MLVLKAPQARLGLKDLRVLRELRRVAVRGQLADRDLQVLRGLLARQAFKAGQVHKALKALQELKDRHQLPQHLTHLLSVLMHQRRYHQA